MGEIPTWVLASWSMLLTIIVAAGSWIVNRAFQQIDENRREVAVVKENSVRRDDFRNVIDRIIDGQTRLENKIDTLATEIRKHG